MEAHPLRTEQACSWGTCFSPPESLTLTLVLSLRLSNKGEKDRKKLSFHHKLSGDSDPARGWTWLPEAYLLRTESVCPEHTLEMSQGDSVSTGLSVNDLSQLPGAVRAGAGRGRTGPLPGEAPPTEDPIPTRDVPWYPSPSVTDGWSTWQASFPWALSALQNRAVQP